MRNFGPRTTAEEASVGIDLTGKVAIVTGANSGIGAETARVLSLRGAHVIMACRDLARADDARQRILKQSRGRVPEERLELMRLDLASLSSVRGFASDIIAQKRRLHLLITNAGVLRKRRVETADGCEAPFGINHLGHFLLTTLLLDTLEASAPSRVVSVSSAAMRMATLDQRLDDLNWTQRRYHMWRAYADSKLMNLMFVRELDRRVAGSGITAHAVHPGVIATELGRDGALSTYLFALMLMPQMKTVAQGAATTIVAATAPEYGKNGSAYLSNCEPHRGHRLSRDPFACRKLWDISEALVLEKGHSVEHSLLSSSQPPMPIRGSGYPSQRPSKSS
jgi:NAD(P)-dependent dehydrogenase (short-subunit alcohol dehydrogenase family)